MEIDGTLQYKRAVILAESLTEAYNKYHYSYSEAGWEASNIFREKGLDLYGIIPMVYYVDGKIVVMAELSEVNNETTSGNK